MMPTDIRQTDHFAMDGPVGWQIAVIIGLLLLGLLTWSLRRERTVLGLRITLLFWALRTTALAAALWMLLAPTRVRVDVTTTRKAVALVMDVSGSMRTIDPEGSADDLRWALAQHGPGETSATQALDCALAAAAVGETQLTEATEALDQHQRESRVVTAALAARQAIGRIQHHVRLVSENVHRTRRGPGTSAVQPQPESGRNSQEPSGSDPERTASVILQELDGPEFTAFRQLCDSLSDHRTPVERGWRESLPDLRIRLSGIRRKLADLSREVEQQEARSLQPAESLQTTVRSLQSSSRITRVAGLIERLRNTILPEIAQTADVRLGTFDQRPMPMNSLSQGADLIHKVPFDTEHDGSEDASSAEATATDLSSVLEQLARDQREQPVAAAFILTDAAHNQAGAANPRTVAADLTGVPVYVVPIGNTQYVRDVVVQTVYCPAVAMRNDDIVIEAVIQAYDCEGESCVIQLLQDGNVMDSRAMDLDSAFATRRVRFDQKMNEVGMQRFQVAVAPLNRELTELNNTQDFEVSVTRGEIKLLLGDEMPRWEYRYLAQLFRRDARVELDELLYHPRLVATGRRQASGQLPQSVDDWDQYDVVILGDLTAEHFPPAAQNTLIQYLQERGGTAVLIAGRDAMPESFVGQPLIDVLPVTKRTQEDTDAPNGGYAFHVTESGQAHNALMIGETEDATRLAWDFVNQFAPLPSVSQWRQPRPAATSLIAAVPRSDTQRSQESASQENQQQEIQSSSFLCWQPVGRGRIVWLAGPDTYRLRFLRGDRLHYRFWGQLLRWALAADVSAGTELVRIRTDQSQYRSRETVQVVVRLTDTTGRPVVTSHELRAVARMDSDRRTSPLVPDEQIPGQYTAELRGLSAGEWEVQPEGDAITQTLADSGTDIPSVRFTMQPDRPAELLDTRCDRALAQQIADITGGQLLPPTAVEEILRLTDLNPEVTRKMTARPLWVEWKYLWIIFGCLQAEWVIRKVRGLS